MNTQHLTLLKSADESVENRQVPQTAELIAQLDSYCAAMPPLQTREELIAKMFRAPRQFQRLQAGGWLKPVEDLGSRESLFWTVQAKEALRRLYSGERPPRLPSENQLTETLAA